MPWLRPKGATLGDGPERHLFVVRRFMLADVPAVSRAVSASFHEAHDHIIGAGHAAATREWGFSPRRLTYARWFSDLCIVADHEGTPVGYLQADLYHGATIFVWMLYVDPDYQRMNVGSALLATAIGQFPYAREMQVEVLSENAPAIAFYGRHRFETISEREHATGTAGVPSKIMKRLLDPVKLSFRKRAGAWAERMLQGRGAPVAVHPLRRAPSPWRRRRSE